MEMEKSPIVEYLEDLPELEKEQLERIRLIIKQVVPEAVEVISYGMPGFKYKGKYLCGFAAFKNHLSFFPTPGPVEDLKDKLSGYKISKGTIQFTTQKPLTDELIKEIVLNRQAAIND